MVTTFDFHALRKELVSFIKKEKFSLQLSRRRECRILTETLDGYQALLEHLAKKNRIFFTYGTKTKRLSKVVLRGLPSGESLDQIKNELTKLLRMNQFK